MRIIVIVLFMLLSPNAFCIAGELPTNPKYFKNLMAAVEQKDPLAVGVLGLHYLQGKGVEKDVTKGARLTLEAARLGEPRSQWHVSDLYRKGLGLQKSSKKAMYWMKVLADRGDADAQFVVGDYYLQGYGVSSKSAKKALPWLKRSAKQGVAIAQRTLARQYALAGNDLAIDYEKAFFWSVISYGSQDNVWKEHHEWLQSMLTLDQMEQTIEKGLKWRPKKEKLKPAKATSR